MSARASLLVVVVLVAGTAACEIKTASAPAAGRAAPARGIDPAPSASAPPGPAASPKIE